MREVSPLEAADDPFTLKVLRGDLGTRGATSMSNFGRPLEVCVGGGTEADAELWEKVLYKGLSL